MHGDGHEAGKIVEEPHIVVADKEMQLDAGIGQFGHFAEQAHMTFGYDKSVSEPEIKHVAKEDHLGSIGLERLQEGAERGFALKGVAAGA